MTSSRSRIARVAEWRIRSICSFIELSPSRCRCRSAGRRPRAGSSRSSETKILDRVLREEALELANRAGRPGSCWGPGSGPGAGSASMTLAMVKVLPEPVTPSSTWSCSPAVRRRPPARRWRWAGRRRARSGVDQRKGRLAPACRGASGRCGRPVGVGAGRALGRQARAGDRCNMGSWPRFFGASCTKVPDMSDTPGVWTGFADFEGERAMNAKVVTREARG